MVWWGKIWRGDVHEGSGTGQQVLGIFPYENICDCDGGCGRFARGATGGRAEFVHPRTGDERAVPLGIDRGEKRQPGGMGF